MNLATSSWWVAVWLLNVLLAAAAAELAPAHVGLATPLLPPFGYSLIVAGIFGGVTILRSVLVGRLSSASTPLASSRITSMR